MLKEADLKVGLRVMVPREMVPDRKPWSERFGEVVEIERFLGNPPLVSVRLDGEVANVISCKLDDLDYE